MTALSKPQIRAIEQLAMIVLVELRRNPPHDVRDLDAAEARHDEVEA